MASFKTFDSEQVLLWTMMIEPDVRVEILDRCKPAYFTSAHHRVIYGAVEDLFVLGVETIDPVIVWNRVKAKQEATDDVYKALAAIIEGVPTTATWREHLQSVRQASRQRELAALSTRLARLAVDPSDEARVEEKATVVKLEAVLADEDETGRMVPIQELMQNWDLPTRKNIPPHRLVGLYEIDRNFDLYHPATLTFLAGRPGQGKSTLMRKLIRRMAPIEPVELFTLEEQPEVVRDKMICSDARVNYMAYWHGTINDEERLRAIIAAGQIAELDFRMHNRSSIGLPKIRIVARWHRKNFPDRGAIWIDHLQLMDRDHRKNDNSSLAEITRGLKRVAMETTVPIIACCALNRSAEGVKPTLSSLRDSGAIESDADNVMFIYSPDAEEQQDRLLSLGKNRNGPCVESAALLTAWGDIVPRTTVADTFSEERSRGD